MPSKSRTVMIEGPRMGLRRISDLLVVYVAPGGKNERPENPLFSPIL